MFAMHIHSDDPLEILIATETIPRELYLTSLKMTQRSSFGSVILFELLFHASIWWITRNVTLFLIKITESLNVKCTMRITNGKENRQTSDIFAIE